MSNSSMTELTQQCRAPFPDSDVCQDKERPDGFRPSYIPWDKITKRLDEVFGGMWEWQIQRYEFVANQAVVHGRLTVRNGAGFLSKDGIGTASLTMVNNAATQMGDDLKSAASDALKRAAVLLGIGIQLYDRSFQAKSLADQAQQAAEASLDGRPSVAEASSIRTMLGRFQYPENLACEYLRVAKLEDLTKRAAMELLGGTHPLTVWLNEQAAARAQRAVAHQPPANGGLRASNA